MNNDLEKALAAYENGELEESLVLADFLLKSDADDCETLLLKAKILYKQQKWGDTLNVLNTILSNDPDHTAANNYKNMVIDIIRFWHKDNFNP